MKGFLLGICLLWAMLQRNNMHIASPATVLNCCEGDILLLLDSSGSVLNYEFFRLLVFTAELLRPFSLGRGHVRVGLLQVGTNPNLEFDLDVHNNQESLQKALQSVSQLQGDTNTEAALRVAQRLLTETDENVPKILLWLTDGVQPGDVDKPMSELKAQGVSVLAVSTVHGNYQVLQRAVTPPRQSHLYSVDIDNIEIITEELREAIIKIIRAERLRVVHLTSHSAVLQWRPVLSADSGYYELLYNSTGKTDNETRRVLPGDSSLVELTDLQPDTTYTAALRPESNQNLFSTLSVNFTTLPDVISPAVVSVSDSGPHQIRVSWGPLQLTRVQRYTVEYGAIPRGDVHTVTLHSQQNSTVLTGLEPGTQYLVTVSALYGNGKERAMTVRACTQEGTISAGPGRPSVDPGGASGDSGSVAGPSGRFERLLAELGDRKLPQHKAFYALRLPASYLAFNTSHTPCTKQSSVCVPGLQLGSRRWVVLHCREAHGFQPVGLTTAVCSNQAAGAKKLMKSGIWIAGMI